MPADCLSMERLPRTHENAAEISMVSPEQYGVPGTLAMPILRSAESLPSGAMNGFGQIPKLNYISASNLMAVAASPNSLPHLRAIGEVI